VHAEDCAYSWAYFYYAVTLLMQRVIFVYLFAEQANICTRHKNITIEPENKTLAVARNKYNYLVRDVSDLRSLH